MAVPELIGAVLPFAVAAALSSVPLVAVLTLLVSANGLRPAVLFGIGYLGGVAGVTLAAATFLRSVVTPEPVAGGLLVGVAEIVIGMAAVAAGPVTLRRRRRARTRHPGHGLQKRMLAALRTVRPGVACVVGLAVALRPKSLLLASAVGLVIAPAHPTFSLTVLVVCCYAVFGSSTVIVPVVVGLLHPDGGHAVVASAQRWITKHGHVVTALVVFLVGVVLVGDGLTRL